jgi:hypothetical protein
MVRVKADSKRLRSKGPFDLSATADSLRARIPGRMRGADSKRLREMGFAEE